jgi:acyl-CoA thioester hydrolase
MVLEAKVPESFADANGHMNVTGYEAFHDAAGWNYLAVLGYGQTYIDTRQMSFFDIEHHVRYLNELLVGDTLAIHCRLLGRSAKIIHFMSFLLDIKRACVSNTLEVTAAHVDLGSRRTVPLVPGVTRALDAQMSIDRALDWTPPVCGAMGVRT